MTDVLDFAASAVKSLAWPATAVLAMVLFRGPLTGLLGRVRRVTVSDGTTVIDFRAALADVEAWLRPGSAAPAFARARVAGVLDRSRPPAAIIDAAWGRVQAALGQGASAVPADLAGVVARLHALRNQAGQLAGLDVGDALRFEDAAAGVVAKIEEGQGAALDPPRG